MPDVLKKQLIPSHVELVIQSWLTDPRNARASSVGFLERVLPRYVETRPLSVAVAVVAVVAVVVVSCLVMAGLSRINLKMKFWICRPQDPKKLEVNQRSIPCLASSLLAYGKIFESEPKTKKNNTWVCVHQLQRIPAGPV